MKSSNKNILITTSTFCEYDREPLNLLEKSGFHYTLNPYRRQVTQEEFLQLAGDSVGVIAGTEKIDSSVLNQVKSLRVISRCGSGVDNVDLKTAKDLGIKVHTTPSGPTLAVAELVIGLMLDLLRRVSYMNNLLHQGKWQKLMGEQFSGKTIGIVGFGQIGQMVGKLSHALGAKVCYFDSVPKDVDAKIYRAVSLKELLKESDVITVHLSHSKEVENMIASSEFNLMKPTSYMINCSRGGIINEDALVDALKSKKISGAALDVFVKEPYHGPLQGFDNVILTPHIGSYAREARVKMEMEAVQNLLNSLSEGKL